MAVLFFKVTCPPCSDINKITDLFSFLQGIEGKGKILTQISQFWFDFLRDTIPNHLITSNIDEMPASVHQYKEELQGRAMLVKKLKILPVEAIVRGYITGKNLSDGDGPENPPSSLYFLIKPQNTMHCFLK